MVIEISINTNYSLCTEIRPGSTIGQVSINRHNEDQGKAAVQKPVGDRQGIKFWDRKIQKQPATVTLHCGCPINCI